MEDSINKAASTHEEKKAGVTSESSAECNGYVNGHKATD